MFSYPYIISCSSLRFSDELGDFLDALELGVPVVSIEAVALEGVRLHAVVVPGAKSVEIGALSEFLELLWGLVEVEDLLDAVIVLANIVFVLENAESSVDLVLKSVVHFSF